MHKVHIYTDIYIYFIKMMKPGNLCILSFGGKLRKYSRWAQHFASAK